MILTKSLCVSASWAKDWQRCEAIFDLDTRRKKLEQLEAEASHPDFWLDQARAKTVIDRTSVERAFVKPFDSLVSLLEDCAVLEEMHSSEEDPLMRESLAEELGAAVSEAENIYSSLRLQSLLSGPMDGCNAFITIHPGAGGTEACDWADMLYRMYERFCEKNGLECETMDLLPGDEAGIKSVTIRVAGPYAYGKLKAERGVHRLVRISPFDANKRRHTSFTALDVVAELGDDVEVDVKEDDLRIDTYRSGGAGGQHINKTDSAIRITHLPTGIVVACEAERSQHKNRAKAMSMLKAKIYEYEQDKKRKDLERFYGPKGEIAWGSQIRSYVLQPYTMVKDLRTGCETSNVAAVLDGAIGPFIDAYLQASARGELAAARAGGEEML